MGSWKLLQAVISESERKACRKLSGGLLAQGNGVNGDRIGNLTTFTFLLLSFNLGRKTVAVHGGEAVCGGRSNRRVWAPGPGQMSSVK